MLKTVINELKHHAPYTMLGALSGILLFLFMGNLTHQLSYKLFYFFHPLHVLLSAFVTVSVYKLNVEKTNLLKVFIVGYLGSVGVATVSDSIVPFLGEIFLNLPNREIHLGFIEKWYLINPLAIGGICIALFKPSSRFPHFGHVLLSVWASLFHMTMAMGQVSGFVIYFVILLFLFISVLMPCCVSDIVFPLLFVKKNEN